MEPAGLPDVTLSDVKLNVQDTSPPPSNPKTRTTSCRVILLAISLASFGLAGLAGYFGTAVAAAAGVIVPTWAVTTAGIGTAGTAATTAIGIKLLSDASTLSDNIDAAQNALEKERKLLEVQQKIAEEQKKRVAELETQVKRLEATPKELQVQVDAMQSALKQNESALSEHLAARKDQTEQINKLTSDLKQLQVLHQSTTEYLDKLSTALKTVHSGAPLNLQDLQAVEERLRKQITDTEQGQKQAKLAQAQHLIIHRQIVSLISEGNQQLIALEKDKAALIEKATKVKGTMDSEQAEVSVLTSDLKREKEAIEKSFLAEQEKHKALEQQLAALQPILNLALSQISELNQKP